MHFPMGYWVRGKKSLAHFLAGGKNNAVSHKSLYASAGCHGGWNTIFYRL